MTEDPNKTPRYVRSDKTNLKYGIQAYNLHETPLGLRLLYVVLVAGALVLVGVAVWWFGFRGKPEAAYPAVPEETQGGSGAAPRL